MQLFIQPVGSGRGEEKYRKTMEKDLALDSLSGQDTLTQDEKESLGNLVDGLPFRIWGCRAGYSPGGSWEKMAPGDIVMFYLDGRYIAQAEVIGTFKSWTLAAALWGEDEGKTWENIFFLTKYEKLQVPKEAFNSLTGYESRFAPRGLMRVEPGAAKIILSRKGFLKGITTEEAESIAASRSNHPPEGSGGPSEPEAVLSKDAVIDAIGISRIVYDEGIYGKSPLRGPSATVISQKYNSLVSPKIEVYKEKYGKTPASKLSEFLARYIEQKDMAEDCTMSVRAYYASSKINPYVWGCIYRTTEDEGQMSSSRQPQLYVLIDRGGVKFGFDYGFHVSEDSEMVSVFKTNADAQADVLDALKANGSIKCYPAIDYDNPPAGQKTASPASAEDVSKVWSKYVNLIAYAEEGGIADSLEKTISDAFDDLLPVFFGASGLKKLISIEEENAAPSASEPAFLDFAEELKVKYDVPIMIDEELLLGDGAGLVEQIIGALKSGKNVILVGPPGTGKTRLAKIVCRALMEERGSRLGWRLCTASSDWSPFETIGGYRQELDSTLKFYPGVFLDCLRNGMGEPVNNWLVIDEINRADIDKAFGPMFSVLSGQDVTLPFQDGNGRIEIVARPDLTNPKVKPNRYMIPRDWRIIATMNTMDKASLYEMSYAFMRRFAFIMVDVPEVSKELVSDMVDVWQGISFANKAASAANIADLWTAVNKHRKIGPAIIEDVCRYIAQMSDQSSPRNYQDAISMFVFPQLEGLDEKQLNELFSSLAELPFIKGDTKRFEAVFREFFGIR